MPALKGQNQILDAYISKNINYITPELYNDPLSRLTDIEKQLHGLINSLRKP